MPPIQPALKVPPLLLTALCAMLIAALAWAWPAACHPFPGHRVLAVGLGGLGLAVMLAGAWQFHRRRTTLDPRDPSRASRVVTDGVFRFTRNPMYLGMALVLAGEAGWTASLPGGALVAGFCGWITVWQIRPEERALLALFGDDYRAYQGRVRRWL